LPPEKFEDIALNWRSDSFVNELIGRERMRRASRAYDPDDFKADVPFWSSYTDEALKAETMPISPVGTEPRIGVILSLSDRFASLGRDTKQGLDLAVEADKDEPKLSLQVRDVGADTAGASAAVRELVTAGHASVIVGPLLTEAAVSAADTARELNVPLLSFSKSESFRTGGSIFRLGATTSSQIDSLVNAATGEYSLNRFAVVYPRNPNGQEFEQALKKKLGSLGAQLVFEASYAPGDDASMSQAARELEATEADAVLLPDSIDMSARFLSNLSATFRKRVRPLGTALWDNPVKIANSQALFEGAIFVTPFFPQSTRPVVQQFIESYLGKYQASPNFLAAQGFDVGTIVVSALRQSLRDGSSFADSLSRLPPYDGVTGSISFDPSGDIRRTLYIVEVMKDNFLEKLPGAAAVTPPSAQTVTYRGNQRIDAKTNAPVQEPDDTAASGY
jgi:branched-chain amino acid transport system substrate-binding protein